MMLKRKPILKDGGAKRKNTTVMFVPSTRGSILVKKMKEGEDKMTDLTGFRIKFQEVG